MAKMKKPRLPRTWSGKVLTDEIAERIADEIESTGEVRWARRRPVGRPPAEGDGVPLRVNFRIQTDLYRAIQVRANDERRTVSDVTREALEKLMGEA
jgi:hypothetical protein